MAGCQGLARMGVPGASSALLATQRPTALPLQARKHSAAPLQSRGDLAFEEEASRPHLPAMGTRVMLGRIASQASLAFSPLSTKLALLAAALSPASAHARGL